MTQKESHSARRVRLHRERKRAVAALEADCRKLLAAWENESEQAALDFIEEQTLKQLWNTLLLFQQYSFQTARQLRFTYFVSGGELFVSRKSKSITRATVEIAFRRALKLGGSRFPALVVGPKQLGCFGASYLYPIFFRFGVISSPASQNESQSNAKRDRKLAGNVI